MREVWYGAHRPSLPVAQPFVVTSTLSPTLSATSTKTTSTYRANSKLPKKAATSTQQIEKPLPETVNLAVPFLSQAPTKNWDMPYQEACEEASLIMVDAYLRGRTKAYGPEEGDTALLQLVEREEAMGKTPDLSAEEVVEVTQHAFPHRRVEIIRQPTVDRIRRSLAEGYPVIIPVSGKALGNPHFRHGGPLYHMLVIKGYLKDGRWITNDPGTQWGADYMYSQNVVFKALHDWNEGDVAHGTPVMMVMHPI